MIKSHLQLMDDIKDGEEDEEEEMEEVGARLFVRIVEN